VEWQLRDTSPRTATWLLVTAGDAAAADAAVRAGADMLDVGPAGPAAIGDIMDRHPGIPLCVAWPPAELGGNAILAQRTGARMICADAPAATAALAADVPRAAILLATGPPDVRTALAAGWPVLADVDPPEATNILPAQSAIVGQITPAQQNGRAAEGEADEAEAVNAPVAAAAVCAWLGVTAVRTRHVRAVRRALDMTASIRGLRPPAWAVRGLA
jgi:hypothetical protein